MNADDNNMTSTYALIAEEINRKVEILGKNDQLLIGICGPPGSGKSTTALAVSQLVPNSTVVPMDGFHYTKNQLKAFLDPLEAFARRGAHWTFDAENFVQSLRSLRGSKHGTFPSFDHGVGDPTLGAVEVLPPPDHRVVIVEGNYLTLDISPWNQLSDILDYSFFMDCSLEEVEKRVIRRHMMVNGNTEEQAKLRVSLNDSPNASLVLASKLRANKVIQSI